MRPNSSLGELLNDSSPSNPPESLNLAGLLLFIIPLITIGGNVLVILSVLRFRALQSAINFLILGLAVADLLVALFVMPYAVYVNVYRGMWHLGNLMCDIYMASDVACSTASILLLAVISFDRYRAVSRPIQYSRQSQNIQRVLAMIAGIWVISLAIASPIVFGVNDRPPDASENECRFYNAEFSIGSSIISFVIPCFLVLFVYIRIIVALKKREKAARLRRQKHTGLTSACNGINHSSEEGDEVGRIVAGPEERDCGLPCTPRSSVDESLSENVNVISNDFISEACTSQSRRSSLGDESQPTSSQTSSGDAQNSAKAKKFRNLSRNYSTKHRKSLCSAKNTRSSSLSSKRESDAIFPSIIRTISRRSPRIFRKPTIPETDAMVMSNPGATDSTQTGENGCLSQTETELITVTRTDATPQAPFSRSTTMNSDMLGSPEQSSLAIYENQTTEEAIPNIDSPLKEDTQPTVTFAQTVRDMAGSPTGGSKLKGSFDNDGPSKKEEIAPILAMKIITNVAPQESETEVSLVMSRTCSVGGLSRKESQKSTSSKPSLKKNRNGLAMKLVKKTMKHEQSLKRKVSKAQRKEKRATKTLGVVVGVFLICWVPFFGINIVNAVCILADKDFCQVGFDLFFYCTWLGYMNSFMNPIIYTIFNTEFRRAFKSILFGRNSTRGYMLNKQVHV